MNAVEQLSLTEPPRPATIAEGCAEAVEIIATADREHRPGRRILLVSGGNDSMVLLHVLRSHADLVVHVNTGIGIPQTTEFVRKVVSDMDLAYREVHPPIPYRDLILDPKLFGGFPGPGQGHLYAYNRLKERAIEGLLAELRTKRGERFMLLTGIRNAESRRRMGYSSPTQRKGGQVWVNPLLRWSDELMREYRKVNRLPVNPVTEHLHMSGECLCGAFAHPGELDEIAMFYPDFARMIRGLEAEAKAAGMPNCRWGERPARKGDQAAGPMCQSCTLFDDQDDES